MAAGGSIPPHPATVFRVVRNLLSERCNMDTKKVYGVRAACSEAATVEFKVTVPPPAGDFSPETVIRIKTPLKGAERWIEMVRQMVDPVEPTPTTTE